jgi:hypothetical protein
MTEYEYADVIATYSSNAGAFLAVYLTVVTGYLITAFMAGSRLSSLQVTILSIGFIVAAGVLTYATYGAGMTQVYYTQMLLDLAEGSPQAATSAVIKTLGSLMLGGLLSSLFFMWNVRHPKTK